MTAIDNAWRPFEPSSEACDAARRESEENRCAVCGWTMRTSQCRPGSCAHRPRPERLYAPERAERELREASDLHERALRNGMPPSGRWA